MRERLLAARRRTGIKPIELAKIPPLGAVGLLILGGFRSVAVDILWFRVISLHQDRKFEQERSLIELALEVAKGKKAVAARYLQIDRQRLYRKIKKYDLDPNLGKT